MTPVPRILLAFCLLFLALPQAASAGPYESTAPNAILVDFKSGRVLYEKNADVAIPPASMSKLVTHAAVFDLLKSGELTEDKTFVVSKNAWKIGGAPAKTSSMYAKVKEKISVINLLRGSVIHSGNDASIVLAEGIDRQEQFFVERMTRKAKELGLTHSTFGNSTGLPDPLQLMSVRDLAIVARHIVSEHPKYFPLYGEKEFTWGKIKQPNRNPLLLEYPGADGMKTGYTKEAGYGLVGTVERDGRRLILVVAGLKSSDDRRFEAVSLFDWGFASYRSTPVFAAGDRVGEARVWGGVADSVDLVTRDAFRISISEAERGTAEMKLSYHGPMLAPIEAGKQVGVVRLMVEGKVIAELPVVTAASVAAVDSMWQKAWDSAKMIIFGG